MTKQLQHLPSVETRDVRPSRVLMALGIVFFLMASCMAMAVGTILATKPERSGVLAHELRRGIRLESNPPQDDRRIEAQTARRLTEQGWNSADHASAHIPVAQAMQLLVRDGWPNYGKSRSPALREGEPRP